jgi:protein-S-isoprenylcysteine O-methyltransferase Ste14
MKTILPALAMNLFLTAVLLVCAGTPGYWPAWIYLATGALTFASMQLVLRRDPELAKERARPGPGAKAWDKKLLGVGFLLTLATLVVAGLDAGRFCWAPRMGWPWAVVGALSIVGGMAIFLLALRENRFFSAVVRIQGDRGQTVCRTGPYRAIRHPGNAGMIVGTLGLPLLFLSAWSAIPAALSVALLVARTRLEDAALADELDGYRDYRRATRFRLVPGIW